MPYEKIDYDPSELPLGGDFRKLVDAAEVRFDDFYEKKLNKRYPRYIASEPGQVYTALKWVTDNRLAPGERFVEWGSGFGIATGMAALLGYEATGIELREGLVQIARDLMDDLSIEAQFICASYIPEGYIEYDIAGGTDLVPDDSFGYELESGPIYSDGDQQIEIAEVDLFYVYPWPGEQEMMLKLFDAVAEADALLIAYYGDREICIYRKL